MKGFAKVTSLLAVIVLFFLFVIDLEYQFLPAVLQMCAGLGFVAGFAILGNNFLMGVRLDTCPHCGKSVLPAKSKAKALAESDTRTVG